MKAAVLSDIHANKYALNAVMAHALDRGVDEFWLTGDLFGYGPHALEVLQVVREFIKPQNWILGNQDAIWGGYLISQMARDDAVDVIVKNIEEVEKEPEIASWVREVFEELYQRESNLVIVVDDLCIVFAHSCLKDPYNLYVYPWTTRADLEDFMIKPGEKIFAEEDSPRIILFGHSHIPALIYSEDGDTQDIPVEAYGKPYQLSSEWSLINPGSVGQPRDFDDRAAYAVLDTTEKSVIFYRVEYDVVETAADMQAAHLPESLQKQLLNANGVSPPEQYRQFLINRKKTPGG